MFKKLGTIVLSAAIAVLGFQAPANAADSDPVANSVVGSFINFSVPLSTTVPVSAGVTSISLQKYWTPNASDIATLGGKTIGFQATVTQPNGSSVTVATSFGSTPAGVSASSTNPSASFSGTGGAMPLSIMYPATTLTMPADVSSYTNGYLGASINVMNRSGNASAPLPTGNWTLTLSVTVNGTPVTESNSTGGSWSLDRMSGMSEGASGTSAVAPTGVTGVSASARICVATGLVTPGDALTSSVLINGVAVSSPSNSYQAKVNTNGQSRANTGNVVLASDATTGLYDSVYGSLTGSAPTAGTTYSATYTLLKGATNVTGSCAPAAPAKPTLAFSNGSFQVGYQLTPGADTYSSICNLYDATDLNTVAATATGNSSNNTCTFSAGTIVGHSYVAKVSLGWQGSAASDLSVASDSVVKPVLGYTFTSAVSGITNAGGKLSRVTNSLPMDSSAGTSTTFSDGGSGTVILETEQGTSGGLLSSKAFVLHHVTKSGLDGSFAGTGSATITPTVGGFASTGRFGWYGANHAKWALAYGGFEPNASESSVNFVTGSNASAGTNSVNVSATVLTAACVSAYGAGATVTSSPSPTSTPSVSVVPAVTTNPLYLLNCYKTISNMGLTTYLSNPLLINVTDSTTVSVVRALLTPSQTVNTATVYFSSNPGAGASDAAVTFLVVGSLSSSGASTVASRTFVNMTPSFVFTNSAGTYTPSGMEPQVKLAPLNDGTVWGLLVGTSTQLLKAAGDTITTTTVNGDVVTGFTNSSYSMPLGLQPGSATGVEVVRTSIPVGSIAMASVDPATGNATTAEVATYTVAAGASVVSAYFVASNNVYWLVSDVANATSYSLYKWLDLNFHLTAQTITWANNSPSTLAAGSTATVSATASSSLTVSYGTTDASICTVNASTGVVTAVAGTGNCVVTADQAGNGTYDSAPQVTLTLALQKAAQTISWTSSPTTITVGGNLTLAATSTSGLTITYGSTDSTKCVVDPALGYVSPIATTGTCVVTADQAGNGTYSAAAQKTLTLTISAHALTAQTISWTTSPTSITAGGTVTVAATSSSALAVAYTSTDVTKCTVSASGVVTAVATSGTCTIAANQAGNDTYSAAAQKTLAITIAAVAPVKSAPKVPTVATKLKVGKLVTVALSVTQGTAAKGANVDGLATVVSAAPASKAFCSVVKVVKAKKITGYAVKGLKAGKCSIVVTITGNDIYNSLAKTVVATVTK